MRGAPSCSPIETKIAAAADAIGRPWLERAERDLAAYLADRESYGEFAAAAGHSFGSTALTADQNEVRTRGAALAGPPLGGLLFGLGRSVPFLADAVSYLVAATGLLILRGDMRSGTPAVHWQG